MAQLFDRTQALAKHLGEKHLRYDGDGCLAGCPSIQGIEVEAADLDAVVAILGHFDLKWRDRLAAWPDGARSSASMLTKLQIDSQSE
ncbi:MAG: hypothetical protein E2O35_02455 [Proteobacteria bacterium]|nr:MAG: hypothetical protein E2O35_02455 [Pseudomonadota bacterium]